MAIKSYTVGPGSLLIGETGSETDFSGQVTSAAVVWSVDSEDDLNVLSGETEAGQDMFSAVLSGTMLQDTGVLADFTWDNKGKTLPFVYVPTNSAEKKIVGRLKMRPMDQGGEVKSKPTWDFELPCVGEPTREENLPEFA